MTKFTKGLSGRPAAFDQTIDSDLGVDALRNTLGRDLLDSPADDVGNPGFEIGITAPTTEVGNPGFEIGIGAPTGDDLAPGYGVDSLAGLGTWESVIHLGVSEGCNCSACQGMLQTSGGEEANAKGGGGVPVGANPESGNIGVLLTLGTNPDGSHFFSGNRNVDAALIGSKWGTLDLTYSFPTSGTNYNGTGFDSNGVSQYHIDLGTQQQAAARAAFAQISAATGLTFTEITETDTVHANIRISQTADQDVASAYGGFPSDTRGVAGDIWFGRTSQPYYDLAFQGTWGFSTMMHEIGHTMGLKHGHQDYTNSDLSFYLRDVPPLRQPVPDPGSRRPGLVADDLYAGAVHQQQLRRRERSTSPSPTCSTTWPRCNICTAPTSTPTMATASTPSARRPARCSSTASARARRPATRSCSPSGTAAATTRSTPATTPTASPSTCARASSRPSTRPSWPTTSPSRTWRRWRPATSPCRCSTTTTPVR